MSSRNRRGWVLRELYEVLEPGTLYVARIDQVLIKVTFNPQFHVDMDTSRFDVCSGSCLLVLEHKERAGLVYVKLLTDTGELIFARGRVSSTAFLRAFPQDQ